MNRKLPRSFELPWGQGQVVEEVSVMRPHWEPTIQLLRYEDGEETLRFCYYHGARFGRGPMIVSGEDLKELKPRPGTPLRGFLSYCKSSRGHKGQIRN